MYHIPVHEFHPPVLQELQRLMAKGLALDSSIRQRVDWTKRTLEQTRPSAWTSRIEGALDKPEQLEFLRKQRRETLIEADMLVFGFHALCEGMFKIHSDLFAAIGSAVRFIDEMPAHSPDQWLKPILTNAVLQAEEFRRGGQCHVDGIPNRHDADRDKVSLAALQSAFAEVSATVKAQRVYTGSHNHLSSSLQHLYPLAGAVSPESLGHTYKRDEMRSCVGQIFVDTTNSAHPALCKLAELLPALDAAVKSARDASNEMRKGEKGRVNERQYAARLVSVLDVEPGTCGCYGPSALKDEQKRQNTARLAYQSQRVLLYSQIVAAEDVRSQVLAALREAIVECETLEQEVQSDSRATTDKLFARRLALINCIAADVQLRRAGRELIEAHAEFANDITEGKGQSATAQEYADLKRYYDSFKRTEHGTAGGGS